MVRRPSRTKLNSWKFLPAYFFCSSFRCGIHSQHGPHQMAQNSISTTFPRKSPKAMWVRVNRFRVIQAFLNFILGFTAFDNITAAFNAFKFPFPLQSLRENDRPTFYGLARPHAIRDGSQTEAVSNWHQITWRGTSDSVIGR